MTFDTIIPHFGQFLDILQTGIIIVDEKFKVVFINKWTEERFQSEARPNVGDCITEGLMPSDRFVTALQEAKTRKMSFMLSDKFNAAPFFLSSGGQSISYNMYISPLPVSKNTQNYFLIQLDDITQAKLRENFLKEKQLEIDKEKEQKFLQKRLESMVELCSNMAHEVNNPLAILDSNLVMLKKTFGNVNFTDEKCNTLVTNSRNTIKRISSLLLGLNIVSKVPSKDDFTAVTLENLIDDMSDFLQSKQKEIPFTFYFDKTNPAVKVPFECMRSVFVHLLSSLCNNSLFEITKMNEKWIRIEAKAQEKSIQIKFIDSGKGIPPAVQEKMFLPFFTTKDVGQGAGLGLSTILKIVNNHQGKIFVDNDNPNTCFSITIPWKQS